MNSQMKTAFQKALKKFDSSRAMTNWKKKPAWRGLEASFQSFLAEELAPDWRSEISIGDVGLVERNHGRGNRNRVDFYNPKLKIGLEAKVIGVPRRKGKSALYDIGRH